MNRLSRPGPPAGTQRTVAIDIAYEGTDFVGWQRQARGRSVQGVLERALSKVASEPVTLFAAGRTDAGVHARRQVASFSLKGSATPLEAFAAGTNSLLPEDVRVVDAREMPVDFLVTAEAKKKTYRYFLHITRRADLFLRRTSLWLPGPLDVDAMHVAAETLLGRHDFSSFRGAGSTVRSSQRTVVKVAFVRERDDLWHFEISADGFLKYMVRSVVGTLVDVGRGKLRPGDMKGILASRDRRQAGPTAPAQGLFLWDVEF